jgi:hypothetical protein
MTLDPRTWLRRIGFLPWGLGCILFAAYSVALGRALTGQPIVGSMYSWFLVFLPLWMGQAFSSGRWQFYQSITLLTPEMFGQRNFPQRHEEEQLPVWSGIVGTCWALVGFGMVLHWTRDSSALKLGIPDDTDAPWFGALFVVVFATLSLSRASDAAVVGERYNIDQTTRLIAAESARAAARAQALQSQVQPHFLFNALNTVTALMREDPARGREVLLRLRALLERSLTTVAQPFIPLQRELDFVRDQLEIEQERFRDRLTVTFDVDPGLLTRAVPAFCIQPLVENALRHGIARSLDGGAIQVRASRHIPASGGTTASALRLEVRDTGAGLAPGWREGTGLGNLRQRLAAAYGPSATLTVTAAPSHTLAVVTIPSFIQPSQT